MANKRAITTSKKRVKAILRHEESRIRSEEAKRVKDDLTRFLYVDDSYSYGQKDIVLGAAPERPFTKIAVAPNYRPMNFSEMTTHAHMFDRIETFSFKAIRKCWSDGKGTTVHWYDWEFCGL